MTSNLLTLVTFGLLASVSGVLAAIGAVVAIIRAVQ